MKRANSLVLCALAASLLPLAAQAQAGVGGGMGQRAVAIDCGKARNPEHCAAREKAREICKDKRGPARQDCMADNMPPPDCSKSARPDRCAAMQSARAACKGRFGPDRLACMKEHNVPAAQGVRGGGMGPGGRRGMDAPKP